MADHQTRLRLSRRLSFWWLFGFGFVLILIAAGTAAWFLFQGRARTELTTQLSELGLGDPEIGQVQASTQGLVANDVTFPANAAEGRPEVRVDKLQINHSLTDLIRGAVEFDSIVLTGAEISLPLDQLTAFETGSSFDLSSLKLPAKRVNLRNATVTLTSPDYDDFVIEGIHGTLKSDDQKMTLEGSIRQFAGNELKISGQLNKNSTGIDEPLSHLSITSSAFKIEDGQWQAWPLLPDGLEEWVQAEGIVSLDVTLELDPQQSVAASGKVAIDDLNLVLSAFELPIKISSGGADWVGEQLGFTDLVASTDDNDQITANGSLKIGDFPLQVEFSASFQDLTTTTLRKFVVDLPETVRGRADGSVTGTVEVQADLSTAIRMESKAISESAAYGQVNSHRAEIVTRIESLNFDEQQNFVAVEGDVRVSAGLSSQSINQLISTFELEALDEQLELEGDATGDLNLLLPLATVEQIATWDLEFDGRLPTATISGQPISNVSVEGYLDDDVLVFESIRGTPQLSDSDTTSEKTRTETAIISSKIRWPLEIEESAPDPASISFQSQNVPVNWLVSVLERQFLIAEFEPPAALKSALENIAGETDLSGELQLNSAQPEELKQWKLRAQLQDAQIVYQQHPLKNLSAGLSFVDGVFSVDELNGQLENGGQLAGMGKVDLDQPANRELTVSGQALPADWLINQLPEIVSIFGETSQPAWLQEIANRSWDGMLNIEIETHPEAMGDRIQIEISAPQLIIDQYSLAQLRLATSFSGNELRLEKLTTLLTEDGANYGSLQLNGSWNLNNQAGAGELVWRAIPHQLLADWVSTDDIEIESEIAGTSSGSLKLEWLGETESASGSEGEPTTAADASIWPLDLNGEIMLSESGIGEMQFPALGFDIVTRDGDLNLENITGDGVWDPISLKAQARLNSQLPFKVIGNFSNQRLSQWIQRAPIAELTGGGTEISGIIGGQVQLSGRLFPFQWQTEGNLLATSLRWRDQRVSDIRAAWNYFGDDLKKSAAILEGFGGTVKLVELGTQPQRLQIELTDIDSEQVTELFASPIAVSGILSGEASLNEWSLAETRWADVRLKGSSLLIGQTEFGNFQAAAEYRTQQLSYEVAGTLLAGSLTGSGAVDLQPEQILSIDFPVALELRNASLDRFYGSSNLFRSLKPLEGRVSAIADAVFNFAGEIQANGRAAVEELKWNNQLLTRAASIHVGIVNGQLVLDDVKAELKSGTIAGRASVPLDRRSGGSFELDIRRLDLQRLSEIADVADWELEGQLDARIEGQLGPTVSGRGFIGLQRASLGAVAGQSLRVPIQFRLNPDQASGRIELRRSTFRIFDGNASGKATLNFGSRLSLDTDLEFSKVDTGKLITAVADLQQADQGRLNGRLILKGEGLRSPNDLTGSFRGKLARAPALKWPVLTDLTRFLAGNSIGNRVYDSDEIQLELKRGRVEVRQFNFYNSLAKIAITGSAFLDGRLDLNVAARVEQLNRPTILDELLGSPLANFSGNPASFFTRAAEFLSDRIVFLKIGGTFNRPQIRLDSGQQLREETIRYFLRNSQILPNRFSPNN